MNPKRKATAKLSISLPTPMAEWLRREAVANMDDVSGVIRTILLQSFKNEKRDGAASITQIHNGHGDQRAVVRKRRG